MKYKLIEKPIFDNLIGGRPLTRIKNGLINDWGCLTHRRFNLISNFSFLKKITKLFVLFRVNMSDNKIFLVED